MFWRRSFFTIVSARPVASLPLHSWASIDQSRRNTPYFCAEPFQEPRRQTAAADNEPVCPPAWGIPRPPRLKCGSVAGESAFLLVEFLLCANPGKPSSVLPCLG